ncbi:AN1-type zinc finger protein 1 [Ceratobasidium sp. AG-Ba]|nr:AN1-type zinc finger protein 1 [Ceratobasidium sp. AG-Ba]QRW00102.1 AN1-type zinc finger protein 1 [Ceratobasidium sp. AG-Ba]QRW14629.1 AN1-type zinc finger protein 1 [Ceratobasidium sp. AG-Ba]
MPGKKRCQHEDGCNSAVLRIVGQCPHCTSQFCGTHRLPEHHKCTKMSECKQQAFEKNKARLEQERTVASKMATA